MFRQLGGLNSAGSTAHSFIHRLQQKDDSAWTHYHNVYGAIVFRRYVQAGAGEELAEELAQQVMVAVLDGIDSYQQDNFRGWLWTITKRRLIDHVRAATKPDRAKGGVDVIDKLEDLSVDPAWERQEEDIIRQALHARAVFDRACDNLKISKSDREVFWDHFNDSLSAQHAADALNISIAAFYQRKSRLRAELKRLRDSGE